MSSKPVDLSCPPLSPPKGGVDRWRASLSGGSAVEVRQRQPTTPPDMLDLLEETLSRAPGEGSVQREEGSRGPMGRAGVRAAGSRGTRAGRLVDVTPDPKRGGSLILVTATATNEELLAQFYHACLPGLAKAAPGIEDIAPHSLSETG